MQTAPDLLVEWRKANRPRLTADHRTVQSGDWFVALAGVSRDGHTYIDEAKRLGATRIVAENRGAPGEVGTPAAREFFGLALSEFYGNPTHSMLMIAVTGTSGKTSTSFLIESILQERFGRGHVGLIGTIETRWAGQSRASTHTTPTVERLHGLLSEMHQDHVKAIVMEVSSHALVQERTAGIAWDGVVFLNLSPEHLDYHSTLSEYFDAKKLLFTREVVRSRAAGKEPVAAVSLSTSWGQQLIKECAGTALPFGDQSVSEWSSSRHGQEGALVSHALPALDLLEIRSPLLGTFQKENILAAVTITAQLRCSSAQIAQGVAACARVPGRLEVAAERRFADGMEPAQFLVDYAHKPDALEKVLQSARDLAGYSNRVVCVVGCGGDRDTTKRPVMARIVSKMADRGILTSDNPRSESPTAILKQMLAGVEACDLDKIQVIEDRHEAIREAVETSLPGDLVIIAGKGHEAYQLIWDEASQSVVSRPFDDGKVVRECVEKHKSGIDP